MESDTPHLPKQTKEQRLSQKQKQKKLLIVGASKIRSQSYRLRVVILIARDGL